MKVSAGFSPLQVVLHWATALLVISIWVLHDGMVNTWRALRNGQTPDSTDALIAQYHIWGGMAVLVFALWRLYLRSTRGAPEAPASESAVLKSVASATQVLLYGLLLYLPITGILGYYLGIETANELHGLAKLPIFLLVALHSVAALYHHFILKTDVLRRMMRPR
jgi:cytochrome b561